MFPTVGETLQCRNGQITACKKLLYFVSFLEQWCFLEFYQKEEKKLLFLMSAVGYFCTQGDGGTRINELNNGVFKNNFQLLLTYNLGYRKKQTLKYERTQQLATIYFFFPPWIWMKGVYISCDGLIIKMNVIYNSGVVFFSVQMKNVSFINYIQGILVRKTFCSIEV